MDTAKNTYAFLSLLLMRAKPKITAPISDGTNKFIIQMPYDAESTPVMLDVNPWKRNIDVLPRTRSSVTPEVGLTVWIIYIIKMSISDCRNGI